MATDRRLSSFFHLREFPCYGEASEADVEVLRRQVVNLGDPTRREFGVITPTSWMHWRSGCTPRTGAHADPGTWDFQASGRIRELGGDPSVPWDRAGAREREIREQAHTEVALWMGKHLHPESYGQIIDERSHIHTTRPGVGGRPGETPTGQVLREPEEGQYVFMFDGEAGFPGGAGTYADPISIPGVEAVVLAGPSRLLAWVLGLAILGAVFAPGRS